MFKENKYFGEVWFKNSEDTKCFCVLELIDDKIFITTNLTEKYTAYQIDVIYGMFIGLGYVTFVNCNIQHSSTGIVETKVYRPKYTFVCAYHLIDPINLKTNEFQIDNAAIVKWVRKMNWYNSIEDKVEKQEDIKHQTVISEDLTLTITKSTTYTSNHDFLRMDNVGYVDFKLGKNLSILESIELYNSFQKLFHFIYGKSVQFKSFNFKCLSCGKWASLYYKDDFNKENISGFITLDYDTINEDLSKIIKHWFTNPDITYCADIIIENLLSVKTSHSRRFTNSYSAFEAYSFKFGKTYKNPTVEKYLLEHKELIHRITSIPENEIKGYVSKIVRHRDYLTHRNKIKNNIFSQFELLYISFLLDYIVGIGLMGKMDVSAEVIDKIMLRAKSTYQDMQSVNKLLNKDVLDNS
ncbi:ApeA N-terminal domain 1-containing protein [Winogradskyella sediminis]|uniref:ApeA N-terminal domain-containing protein n=1 Tax=Winogradskyella sediminis TaxID=1382466 RepID=A0A1H1W0M1_9FLAO|nr:hypothetical protein [Winogradskyella sediminis]SDS90046.1 hypothetical protein SAMN04489797_2705 [Winogradskyella sediminis]